MFHIALHFLVPGIVTGVFFHKRWKHAYLAMVATMLVDLDHLIANPIYDPDRCSIGFHPLHHPWLVLLYIALCFLPRTRYIGIGLSIHMCLDAIDCVVTNGVWVN
ncbi:MAG: hypothetical protein HN764_15585 [Gammaproteobacteria bacterium]|jgi:hypothetical protein|nr:hypothetical protein [Gammaproteobacteria bacterium]